MSKIRAIAFYLPQFHPVPENDSWWGKGFTEWTNVSKAKPLFPGHQQPILPGELGYYDLRVPEVREQQAQLAQEYGIEGFMYWHYWFAGRRILERPFQEVLASQTPTLPFCLGWANESWTGVWHGLQNQVLIEQTYPGKEDYLQHFMANLPAFLDKRYIRVDDKPLFFIYNPLEIPNCAEFIAYWQSLAVANGLQGVFFVGLARNPEQEYTAIKDLGFDAVHTQYIASAIHLEEKSWRQRVRRRLYKWGLSTKNTVFGVFSYQKITENLSHAEDKKDDVFPLIIPNWDNSPRSGRRSLIFEGSTPELFRKHVSEVLTTLADKPDDRKVVFIKSWNEWAEGNYLEPDQKYGRQYLEVFKEALAACSASK